MLPANPASDLPTYGTEAQYKESPTQDQIKKGVVPLDSLPAQWWNWIFNQLTLQHNLSVKAVTDILQELLHVLALANIVPEEASTTQLAQAIKKLTSDVIGDFSELQFGDEPPETVVGALNVLYQDLSKVSDAVEAIEAKIPEQASEENQLADKEYVQKTVATNVANFRGNWGTWEDVPSDGSAYPKDYTGNTDPTTNDYMTVRDASGYGDEYQGAWRFKYTGSWDEEGKTGWNPEYYLGNMDDTSELAKYFAKGSATSLDIGTVTAEDGVVRANEDIIVGTGPDAVSFKDFRTLVIQDTGSDYVLLLV